MTSVVAETERDQVVRWMQDGRHVLELMAKSLDDFDQLKARAEALQSENERLRLDGEELRAEVGRLTAEIERGKAEREAIAQWFAGIMSEGASRLGVERPSA